MTDHFFIVQKELYPLKVWGLLCHLFTWFSHLLLCQEQEFIGFRHGNKKQLPPENKNFFWLLFAVWIYIPQIYIYILGIQHKLMVWPVCAPAVWIIDFPAQTSANIRPSRITDAQANIHLPWTLHTLYAKREEGQVSLAGWEKKENKEIYIAAAVQRLQEAWHVPICPAEVADSRNETIYHVDTQLITRELPPSTA